jgi:DNA repair exonuclease SbcCD ATPase subunit
MNENGAKIDELR